MSNNLYYQRLFQLIHSFFCNFRFILLIFVGSVGGNERNSGELNIRFEYLYFNRNILLHNLYGSRTQTIITEAMCGSEYELIVDKTPSTNKAIGFQHYHPWYGKGCLNAIDDSIIRYIQPVIVTSVQIPKFVLTHFIGGVHSSAGIV